MDNGYVISKTDGVDTYTFTYTRELKVETISLNAQVLHTFGYDANGDRVVERRADGTLITPALFSRKCREKREPRSGNGYRMKYGRPQAVLTGEGEGEGAAQNADSS